MKNYPVIKVALAFITGILLNQIIPFSYIILIILFTSVLITSALFVLYKRNLNTPAITFLIYLLLIQCGSFTAEVQADNYVFIPETVIQEDDFIAYGSIRSISLIREKEVSYVIKTDSFLLNERMFKLPVEIIGKLRNDDPEVLETFYSSIYPGYYLEQKGRYKRGRDIRNPGEFDYNLYLHSLGISGILTSSYPDELNIIRYEPELSGSYIFEIRKAIDKPITLLHEKQTASLLRGLILADRSGIDFETKEEFINSGVMHILAVSGLHTGYIALIFLLITGRFNITVRSILTAAGLLVFLVITGMPVSVFRAVVMAIVFVMAVLSGRSSGILNSLSLAALIILMLNPSEIFNPGFQLSFAAVLSIGLIYPILQERLAVYAAGNSVLRYLILFIVVSAAAQIGTLPLIIYYFGKLSLISIAANIFVIPLCGFIIAAAIVTLFLFPFIPFISFYYAAANDLLALALFNVVHYSGGLEYSFMQIPQFTAYDTIICYLLMMVSLFYISKAIHFRTRIIFTALMILNVVFLTQLDEKDIMPEGMFSLMMIDVGQGDSFLMKFPDGTTFLIDAGDANKYFDTGERVVMPLIDHLGIRRLDYAFISHLDLDHYGGMISLLQSGRVKHLMIPAADYSEAGKRLEKYLIERGQSFSSYHNEVITSGNVRIYSLYDDKDTDIPGLSSNNKSGILKVVYGNTSFLFTGDLDRGGESYYLNKYGSFLRSDVLKISHHGSSSGTSREFLNIIDQDFALISAGYKNRFNHPSAEVTGRLNEAGTKILRTDFDGAVLLYSDGNRISEINWKKGY